MYCWWAANSLAICSVRAAAKDSAAIGSPVSVVSRRRYRNPTGAGALRGPAEARVRRSGLQRAVREAVGHARVVVAGGRDVVGGVGVEDRGQVLDLAPPHRLLALATAVDGDPLALAVLVDGHQLPQGPEARGLGVDRLGLPLERLDVRDGMER